MDVMLYKIVMVDGTASSDAEFRRVVGAAVPPAADVGVGLTGCNLPYSASRDIPNAVHGSGMFKITIRITGIRADVGDEAVRLIEAEFRTNRRWHERVCCSFADGAMILSAYNDYDGNGLALLDEVSDCVCAFIPIKGRSDDEVLEVVAVEQG